MIEINTAKRVEVIDITLPIEKALEKNDREDGLCLVFSLHTTTAVIINEAESGVMQDITNLLSELAPAGKGYLHDRTDGNAHAHLQAALLGNSLVIPVKAKKPVLGTWQRILFLELDGPRRRRIEVEMISA
ncbi:MAG: YjbQ family protein [Methanotrichaceae archaeon]|nr:YjbQ family protein [Methanotrichaceae archaeon]